MIERIIAKLAVFALRHKKLSGEQKLIVTSALLDNLNAIPIQKIITFDQQGTVYVRGKQLSANEAIAFRESCIAMQDSFARKIINEQIKYEAISLGIHIGDSVDKIIFSKSALWLIEQENELLARMSI